MPRQRVIGTLYHVQLNNLKEMKKILASLFVASVTICSASAANAQAQPVIGPTVSIHSGTVPASCRFSPSLAGSLTATPGTLILSEDGKSLSSLTSLGSFTVICNSTHSFAAKLITGVKPSAIVETNYSERFRFINTPAPYTTINTTGFSNTFTTVSGLPVTPNAGYVVGVAAEARLVDGTILPVSITNGYVINVEATVTAN
jgi:hypothetical protein